MANHGQNMTSPELSSRLQRLMLLRVLIVTVLLGASVFVHVRQTATYAGDTQTSHFVLISTVYVLTFLYIVLLKRMQNLIRLAYIQLLVDTFLVTAVIFTTGGNESFFSFLYILTIISGSILLYRRGGLIIASSSSILYGILLDLHYYQVITPYGSLTNQPMEEQAGYIFFRILAHTAAFYLVAILSSYLSEQTRRSQNELQAQKVDMDKLEMLNDRIVKSIASGLITVNDDNRIILFNPAAEQTFGIPSAEANGRVLTDVLPFLGDDLESDSAISPERNQPPFVDLPYQNRQGEELFLRLTSSPLSLPGGEEKGRILVFQDMTEIKRIEMEMQRVEQLAMVGELAAGIAHEIRNPMASISGSIQMLKEGMDWEKDEVSSRLMDIVIREVNRLNHLVNDFLQYARPRKGSFMDFELNTLIRETLDLFEHTGGWTKHIQVETHLGGPVHLHSDPEQLKQVLWNLFLNARDAMPTGGLLRVKAREPIEAPYGVANRSVELTVRDTGEGFSENALNNLFTPFFTTKAEGSGLGLATVKRIIEGLMGQVHGGNHPEGGARIVIYLPVTAESTEIL